MRTRDTATAITGTGLVLLGIRSVARLVFSSVVSVVGIPVVVTAAVGMGSACECETICECMYIVRIAFSYVLV